MVTDMHDPEDMHDAALLHDDALVELLMELDDDALTEWEREFRAHLDDRMHTGDYRLSELQRDKALQMIQAHP